MRPKHDASGGDCGVKRSTPEAGPPLKKQRTHDTQQASATMGPTKPECTKGIKRSQITPEQALFTALENLKNVLQAMCVDQRRQAISRMVLRVRTVLLSFMEKQKKRPAASKSQVNVTKHEEKAMLPLEDADSDMGCKDPSCSRKTSDDHTVVDTNESNQTPRKPPLSALSQNSCTDCSGRAGDHAADTGNFVQTRNLKFAQWKQQVPASAMTGIQCKKARYKAHLHIKSFRIYTDSHAKIEDAIDHQIILMQIRLAWTAAWQSNPYFWEDHPEQAASLCNQVLQANGTSESEMGLKAFVSMEARLWLGKNCFVISPVMQLSEALAWQAKLLCARRVSWPIFREGWVELMQCRRYARAKVRSAEEAQLVADAAYERHQKFLVQHIHERKMREEAKMLARQERQENRERQQQIKREKLMQARSARQKAKRYALLEKRLSKAVRSVERALHFKARNDARLKKDSKARAGVVQ